MDLFKHQDDILEKICSNRFTFIRTRKHIGTTTVLALYSIIQAMEHGKKIIVFCPNGVMCNYFRGIILRFILNNNGDRIKHNNKDFISFRSGGSIKYTSVNSVAFKGYSVDIVIVDNVSIGKLNSGLIDAVLPLIVNDPDRKMIICDMINRDELKYAFFSTYTIFTDFTVLHTPKKAKTFIKTK